MIVIDDIRSLRNQLLSVDPHDYLRFNDLAYHDRNEEDLFAYCPFCGKPVKLKVSFSMEETRDRIKLKRPISCDCRKGLRYLNKDFESRYLQKTPAKDTKFVWKILLGIAIALIFPMRLYQMEFEYASVEEIGASFFIMTALPFVFGLLALITYFAHPEKKYKKLRDPDRQRETVMKAIAKTNGMNPVFVEKKKQAALRKMQQRGYGRAAGYGTAAGAGIAAAGSSWIPDDFEPDLDPYDREALYTDQLMDDWVIAGGGNPYDYGDRVDAFSDPFGFHDDFGGGDGGFGGFGDGWGGGFGGGDD